MKWKILSGLLTLLLVTGLAAGQSTSIHQEIQQTYNFQPHLLTNEQITPKSALLDQFWSRAKAGRSRYVPALRQELADFQNSRFFLYDGSMLLLSLSDEPVDRKTALAAMARCDLRDVQPKDYFAQVHRMASLNEDTTAAGLHVLDQPGFKVFVPEHFLTLGQDYVLIYLLLPTDQDYWLQPAINRLKVEQDAAAQKSLLMLLFYVQTDTADQVISTFAGDDTKPQLSRTYAQSLVQRKDQVGAKQQSKASNLTEATLRQKRRERLKAVSDEALIDLDDYTLMLIAKRK
jgi:hypothetical protein